jgi:hypothetical protein
MGADLAALQIMRQRMGRLAADLRSGSDMDRALQNMALPEMRQEPAEHPDPFGTTERGAEEVTAARPPNTHGSVVTPWIHCGLPVARGAWCKTHIGIVYHTYHRQAKAA